MTEKTWEDKAVDRLLSTNLLPADQTETAFAMIARANRDGLQEAIDFIGNIVARAQSITDENKRAIGIIVDGLRDLKASNERLFTLHFPNAKLENENGECAPTLHVHDKPLAAPGLKSYRYRRAHGGFVMIGAKDRLDALNEAARSLEDGRAVMDCLEEWDPAQGRYVSAVTS